GRCKSCRGRNGHGRVSPPQATSVASRGCVRDQVPPATWYPSTPSRARLSSRGHADSHLVEPSRTAVGVEVREELPPERWDPVDCAEVGSVERQQDSPGDWLVERMAAAGAVLSERVCDAREAVGDHLCFVVGDGFQRGRGALARGREMAAQQCGVAQRGGRAYPL